MGVWPWWTINGDYIEDLRAIQEEEKAKNKDGLSDTPKGAGERSQKTTTYNQAFTWCIQALTQMQALPLGNAWPYHEQHPNVPSTWRYFHDTRIHLERGFKYIISIYSLNYHSQVVWPSDPSSQNYI
ncbi:hypothetical protein GGR57DRAFT_169102 [Xylariaceae sp. FL1272]|nr:hypothetical protein GGR57DRAFT_169102 [Xylariaceae sp. FL1272]